MKSKTDKNIKRRSGKLMLILQKKLQKKSSPKPKNQVEEDDG